jgi:hypothetical protein
LKRNEKKNIKFFQKSFEFLKILENINLFIPFIFLLVSYIISRAIFVPISLVYPCLAAELTPFGVKFICVGIAG